MEEKGKIDLLEELAAQELLIEMYNAKKAEVFENVVFNGTHRYYIEDLTKRDYTLESTTPYQFEYDGYAFEEGAWSTLICKVTKLLLDLYPNFRNSIYDFRCPWSKAVMFTHEIKTNYKEIGVDLYVNCNHTALHSCWFIQDLLDYFGIDKSKVHFLIHRPSSAEPQRVKEYIENRFKRNFVDYIVVNYNRTKEQANKVIFLIEKYINSILSKISKSHTNIFLFDDKYIMQSYVKKIKEYMSASVRFDKKSVVILNKYLDWIIEFYKK